MTWLGPNGEETGKAAAYAILVLVGGFGFGCWVPSWRILYLKRRFL